MTSPSSSDSSSPCSSTPTTPVEASSLRRVPKDKSKKTSLIEEVVPLYNESPELAFLSQHPEYKASIAEQQLRIAGNPAATTARGSPGERCRSSKGHAQKRARSVSPDLTAESRSAVLQELELFFDWALKDIQMPAKKPSPSTRPPAYYDQHLHEDLILKKVVLVPNMAQSIAEVVDNHLKGPLPAKLGAKFPVDTVIESHEEERDPICGELSVEFVYKNETARFCGRVASGLLFNLDSFNTVISVQLDQSRKDKSIPDAVLKARSIHDLKSLGLKPVHLEQLDLLRSWGLDNILHWEFKNLRAGRLEVFQAIVGYASDSVFEWTDCPDVTECKNSEQHQTMHGFKVKTGHRTSKDWAELRRKLRLQKIASAKKPLDPNAPSRKLLKDCSRGSSTNAHNILQQAWGESVRVDTTFFIINAGNYEIVCVRDRRRQTLYISDVIDTRSHKQYAKMHTGVYMLAYQDALGRVNQLVQLRDHGELPACFTVDYPNDDPPPDALKGLKPNNTKGPQKAAQVGLSSTDINMLEDFSVAQKISVNCQLGKQKKIRTALRSYVGPNPGDIDSVGEPDFLLTLIKLLPNGTHTYVARLQQLSTNHTLLTPLVAKLRYPVRNGDCTDLGRWLEGQSKVSSKFNTPGLLNLYGLFTIPVDPLVSQTFCGQLLVMDHGGISLAASSRSMPLTSTDADLFRRALSAVHKANVLHNDISEASLLRNIYASPGRARNCDVSIIKFDKWTSSSKRRKDASGNALTKDSEAKELDHILISSQSGPGLYPDTKDGSGSDDKTEPMEGIVMNSKETELSQLNLCLRGK